MTSGGKNQKSRKMPNLKLFRRKLDRWLDEWKLAASGIVLATKNRRFLIAALLTFIIFGTLMNLFSGSTAALDLFWQVDFLAKFKIIFSGFLGIFGIDRNFLDWLLLFSVTVLQSILIGLVALVWSKANSSVRLRMAPRRPGARGSESSDDESAPVRKKTDELASTTNADNLQTAGLAAGLAVLGTGCPTCGTTLLAPLIGTLFSTSSYAIASTISGLLTVAAVVVALLTLKRLGNDAYAMIVSAKYRKRNQPNHNHLENNHKENRNVKNHP